MRRGIPSLGSAWRLLKLLRARQPDVLQTWLYHADLLGIVIGKLSGVARIVWNIRCSDMQMEHYSWLSRAVLRLLAWMSRIPDAVVVNSAQGRIVHEQIGYRPKRWEFIPNGVDINVFRPDQAAHAKLRATLGLPEDAFIVGVIARFDTMKDHQTFLRALVLARARGAVVHAVLVGAGIADDNRVLSSLIADLGVEHCVHLMGERADLPQIMAAVDGVVLSSAFGEGFPNVVAEAMACSVPCIVTDVGDAADIVADSGCVVRPRDVEGLATALVAFWKMPETERIQRGIAARERTCRYYSLDRAVNRYEKLYRSVVSNSA